MDICGGELTIMMKTFLSVNRWYDNLKEPERFLIAMAVICIPIVIVGAISCILKIEMIHIIFFCVWSVILILIRMLWVLGGRT